MKTLKDRRKETIENIEKFSKELQLLNQRVNFVTTELARLQGEGRLIETMEKEEKEEKKGKK